jgi:hypothetical protein
MKVDVGILCLAAFFVNISGLITTTILFFLNVKLKGVSYISIFVMFVILSAASCSWAIVFYKTRTMVISPAPLPPPQQIIQLTTSRIYHVPPTHSAVVEDPSEYKKLYIGKTNDQQCVVIINP